MLMIKRLVLPNGASWPYGSWDGQHYVQVTPPMGTGYSASGIVDDIVRYATYLGLRRVHAHYGEEYFTEFPVSYGTPIVMFRNREQLMHCLQKMLAEKEARVRV